MKYSKAAPLAYGYFTTLLHKSMLLQIGNFTASFQLEWLDLDCSGDVAAFYFL